MPHGQLLKGQQMLFLIRREGPLGGNMSAAFPPGKLGWGEASR